MCCVCKQIVLLFSLYSTLVVAIKLKINTVFLWSSRCFTVHRIMTSIKVTFNFKFYYIKIPVFIECLYILLSPQISALLVGSSLYVFRKFVRTSGKLQLGEKVIRKIILEKFSTSVEFSEISGLTKASNFLKS
jgi:hypothetical protein